MPWCEAPIACNSLPAADMRGTGSTAIPSPAATASASSTAPAAANPPATSGATVVLPRRPIVVIAAARVTSANTAALGAMTRAGWEP